MLEERRVTLLCDRTGERGHECSVGLLRSDKDEPEVCGHVSEMETG